MPIKPSHFQNFIIKRLGVDKYVQEFMSGKNYTEVVMNAENLESYRLKEYKT